MDRHVRGRIDNPILRVELGGARTGGVGESGRTAVQPAPVMQVAAPDCGYNGIMVRLEHVLDSWKAVRQDTIAAVEEFPAGEFGFRPCPDVMTFGEIACHILQAGHALTGMLLSGEESFASPDFRAKLAPHLPDVPSDATPAQLAAALRDSIDARTAELAPRPADFFAHIVTRMDGQKVTRLEMIQMVKEHELTHRAHLFLYMRMKGLVPATTRRRMAQQAAR